MEIVVFEMKIVHLKYKTIIKLLLLWNGEEIDAIFWNDNNNDTTTMAMTMTMMAD